MRSLFLRTLAGALCLFVLAVAGCGSSPATHNVGHAPNFLGAVILVPANMAGGQPAKWTAAIYGGQPPYTVSWNFGGGATPNTVTTTNQNTPLNLTTSAAQRATASIRRGVADIDAVGSDATVTMITGTWTVEVTITDALGVTSSASRDYTVGATQASNEAPVAVLNATPDTGTLPLVVSLDAGLSADPDGTLTKYEWDFDGDGTYDLDSGTTSTAQHTYPAAGTYHAKVRVTDDGNPALTATATHTITVTLPPNKPPTVSVAANPGTGVAPLAVNLTATAADPDGAIAKYEWDFDGDGTFDQDTGTTATVAHTYPTPGTYQAKVRVTDNGSPALQATASVGVTVNANQPPTVSVVAQPKTGKIPLSVDFTATASDPDGTITKYEWDFDNDGTFDLDSGTTATATHDYPAAGTYTCLVRVTDNGTPGLTSTATVQVTANANQPPTVSLGADVTQGKGPLTVNFTATASDPDGTITKYEWDFDDDGTFETDTGTTPTAQHIYPFAQEVDAVHTCRVRVTDDGTPDLTATATVSVTVHPNRPPTVSVTPNPAEDNSPLTVTFTATASDPDGTITDYQWDLDGDGSFETDTGTTPTVQHTYQFNEGPPITVTVQVTDDGTPNLNASATTQITVDPPNQAPTALFQASNEGGSAPLTLSFDGSQSFDTDGVITKYVWDWGDGSALQDTGNNPMVDHTFVQPGQYSVTLTVTDDGTPLLTGTSDVFTIFVFNGAG